ncbi:MAG: hypothetical protein IJ368_00835 [Oscillospiraceae bacterium]|nr:hypothetical protein [Oscillospiraceae bacterium]
MIIAAVFLIALGLAVIIALRSWGRRAERLKADFSERFSSGREYDAAVLDRHRETIRLPSGKTKTLTTLIVQFRIEEQKKTVVHWLSERFYGKYERGDSVKLLFCESMPEDRAVIIGDNEYDAVPRLYASMKIPLTAVGIISMTAGIIILFL